MSRLNTNISNHKNAKRRKLTQKSASLYQTSRTIASVSNRSNDSIAFAHRDRVWNLYVQVKTWYDRSLNTHRNLCETNPYLHSFVQHERTYTHGEYHQYYKRAQLVCDYLGERRWNGTFYTHFGGRRNQFHFYPNRNFLRNFQLYC